MSSRQIALLAFLTLGALLAVVLAVVTPWSPVPGPRVPADPSRDFTAAQIAREDAFHSALRPWTYGRLALGLVVVGVLGFTPLGARLVGWMPGGWPVKLALGTVVMLVVARLCTLPLSAGAYTVLRDYGLSTQTWAAWLGDLGRSLGIGILTSLVAVIAFYAAVRRFPTSWWLPVGLGGAALVIAFSFVYPLVIEPVFNKFTPLQQGELRTSLLELAERDGVAVENVLVADASRRTSTLNAYVSGFGATRRIVVYDTLLEKASEDEVRLIVAHELGHAKRNDVVTGTLIAALAVAVTASLGFLLLSWPGLLSRAGVESLTDPRSLALVLALVGFVGFLASPIESLVSRRIEARADVHSLELTRDAETFVESEKRLAVNNLSDLDPHPLVYAWFFSHPSAPERIALARTWDRTAR